MNGIKIVLVTAFIAMLVWALRNRRRAGLRAGGRLLLAGLVLLAVAAVLHPELTTWMAKRLGVGRGTDLVLYLFIVVMSTTAVVARLHVRDLEQRLNTVVRVMALRDAAVRYGLPDADRRATADIATPSAESGGNDVPLSRDRSSRA